MAGSHGGRAGWAGSGEEWGGLEGDVVALHGACDAYVVGKSVSQSKLLRPMASSSGYGE